MFPPKLQKNIQELERQISLLETECKHIEAEKQEPPAPGKNSSKTIVRELSNQPFITGPGISASSYSSRMINFPPVTRRVYSSSCSHFRTTTEKLSRVADSKNTENTRTNCGVSYNEPSQKTREPRLVFGDSKSGNHLKTAAPLSPSPPNQSEATTVEKPRADKKPDKRSIPSIQEVIESSDESYSPHPNPATTTAKSKNSSQEQTWCELFGEPPPTTKKISFRENFETKLSSDEECGLLKEESYSLGANWQGDNPQVTPRVRPSTKRRPRSARTKKNPAEEMPTDLTADLLEKEIQCALWNEEKEKEHFFNDLNESINILHFLIGELKTKLTREKRDDVLNDMQNTLLKISGIKSINSVFNPLTSLSSSKEPCLLEGEQSIVDVKSTLLGLKKFCQELSDEKLTLTREISVKNRTLANFRNKEKEYLTLISSLKYNLEKMKEEADEGALAKRDLKVLRIKFQEETKVIEALKKSHGKMQELVENYVLENDKLRTEVKITKLEAQKFNVLLAAKEAEINKRKKEIESFQRQITEQLSLLRSKATENEVQQTIEAIKSRGNILSTEMEKEENLNEITPSPSTVVLAKNDSTDEWDVQTNSSREPKTKGSATSNENPTEKQLGLKRVLSKSKNLRTSINQLLMDSRKELSNLYWMTQSNSSIASSPSPSLSPFSEDLSEGDQTH